MPAAERGGFRGPPAGEVLRALLPAIGAIGITRIGDITGLDRLGIPVMQATRPLSLSNSVAQGKGATREAAAVSAILEAAECFFAERHELIRSTTGSAADLGVDHALFASHLAEDCPPRWHEKAIGWATARNVLTGAAQLVPLGLVHTAYIHPGNPRDAYFNASTSGLAVACNEHDAVLHGLLECFERDALARAHRVHGFFQRFRIDPETIGNPGLGALVGQAESAGLLVGLWHAPGRCGVPVVWCHLLERDHGEGSIIPFPAEGSAAGFDPAETACRAIREAAQSRLAAISGAREDITRQAYPRYPDWSLIEAHRRLLREGPRPVHLASLGERVEPGEDGLATLIRLAEKADLGLLLAIELDTRPFRDLKAVKVLAPELMPLGEAG